MSVVAAAGFFTASSGLRGTPWLSGDVMVGSYCPAIFVSSLLPIRLLLKGGAAQIASCFVFEEAGVCLSKGDLKDDPNILSGGIIERPRKWRFCKEQSTQCGV